ncbi:MAG: acyltransferase [Clostridia bacterium]|nr:acyltransferase [Clostridia bacterium]
MINKEKISNFVNNDETLEEKYDRKSNIFDYIKIILALFVIIAHSYPIFFGGIALDPISEKILKTESLGGIAVIGFLMLSGFMTTQSIIHSKNHKEFFFKRILRIYPSLIIMLLITIFIIAPLGYEGNKNEYFNKSVSSYFFKNLNLFGNTVYGIDGVFTNNIYPNVINGSIWTLKHEFMAYIVLIVLSLCSILKERKYTLGITILTIFLYVLGLNAKLNISFLGYFGVLTELNQFIKLLMYFLIGATIYLYKDRIQMNFRLFVMACIMFLFGIVINITNYVAIFAIPYIIMYIGTFKINKKIDIIGKIGDCTYAMYIYAFPIQQILAFYLKNKVSICQYMILSILITIVISIITTMLIDNNIKKLKTKIFVNKKI